MIAGKKNDFFSYLVTISYDGSLFFGWAKQKDKFTAQGYIESVLSKVFSRKIAIKTVSRLDKGVHAENQKFLFCLKINLGEEKLFFLLKKTLKMILIKKVLLVENSFFLNNKVLKEYRYFLNTGKFNLWKVKYRWEYCFPLMIDKLQDLLNIFVGEHDFFNFCYCKIREQKLKNTRRKIDSIKVNKQGSLIVFIFKGRGFLRYQIRAIIGEVICCYENKLTLEDLKKKLFCSEGVINKYRYLAPPSGLYLWKINFVSKNEKKIIP